MSERPKGFCMTVLAFQLQAYNIIDFVIGLALGVFDWYLIQVYSKNTSGENNVEIFVVIWLAGILGALLLLSSFLSFCAITNNGCRSTLIPSAYIGVVIAFVSAFLGTLIFALQKNVYAYLKDDPSGQFSSKQINTIENFYIALGISLFALTITQVLRFRASHGFRAEALRIDGEFDTLLDTRDKAHQDEMNRLKTTWEQRYAALRTYYEEKYSGGGDARPPPSSPSPSANRYRDEEEDGRTYYSAPSLPIHPTVPTILPVVLPASDLPQNAFSLLRADEEPGGYNQRQQQQQQQHNEEGFSRTSTLTSADDTLFGPDE